MAARACGGFAWGTTLLVVTPPGRGRALGAPRRRRRGSSVLVLVCARQADFRTPGQGAPPGHHGAQHPVGERSEDLASSALGVREDEPDPIACAAADGQDAVLAPRHASHGDRIRRIVAGLVAAAGARDRAGDLCQRGCARLPAPLYPRLGRPRTLDAGQGLAYWRAVGCITTTWLAHPNQRLRRSAGYRRPNCRCSCCWHAGCIWVAQRRLPGLDAVLTRPDEVFFDCPFLLPSSSSCSPGWRVRLHRGSGPARLAAGRAPPGPSHRAWRPRHHRAAQTDRPTLLRQFVARWVGWGIFLIMIAAALRMGVNRERFWTLMRQDVDPLAVGAIVVYFLAGLLLISQGQLAVLRARWTTERMPGASPSCGTGRSTPPSWSW